VGGVRPQAVRRGRTGGGPSSGSYTFTYTANGELATKVQSGVGTTTYTYDVLGNLTRVVLPNTTIIDYIIDGENRRVGKKVNNTVVKRWLYHDGLKPVAELDGSGALVSQFVYGSNPNVPDYVVKNGVKYRIVSDQLGSVRLVINVSTGAVAQVMQHDAWGNVVQDTSVGFTPFGFAGGLYDPDTGLVRFGARDYDPVVGRWTAKDPARFESGNGLYEYSHSNPVNQSDQSGLDPDFGSCFDSCMGAQGADIAGDVALMCVPFAPTPKTPWEYGKTLGGGSPLTTWASRLAAALGLNATNVLRTAGRWAATATAVPFAGAGAYWATSASLCALECSQ
jgi:RHS repeat-associated protein